MEQQKKLLREATYFLLLALLVVFTVGIAFLITPLYLAGSIYTSILVTVIVGLSFGAFTLAFIKMLDLMTKHHHAGIWVSVFGGSIMGFVLIYIGVAYEHAGVQGLHELPNPILIASIFSASFLLPYLLFLLEEKRLAKR